MEKDLLNLQEFIDLYYKHTTIKLNIEDAIILSNELITFVENILLINTDNNNYEG